MFVKCSCLTICCKPITPRKTRTRHPRVDILLFTGSQEEADLGGVGGKTARHFSTVRSRKNLYALSEAFLPLAMQEETSGEITYTQHKHKNTDKICRHKHRYQTHCKHSRGLLSSASCVLINTAKRPYCVFFANQTHDIWFRLLSQSSTSWATGTLLVTYCRSLFPNLERFQSKLKRTFSTCLCESGE